MTDIGGSATKGPADAGLETDIDELRDLGTEVSFGPGDVIFEAGDRSDAIFVVLEGEAQVDVGGRFHRLRAGDVFGEMGLLTGDRRMATVRAVETVRAMRFESDSLKSLLEDHPELDVTLLRILTRRLREVEQRIDAWMAP